MAGVDEFFVRLINEEPWRKEAACRTADASLFYPVRGQSTLPAKRICKTCPVQEQCRKYAEAQGIEDGIWAGESRRK